MVLAMDIIYLKYEEGGDKITPRHCNLKSRGERKRVVIDAQPLQRGTYFRGIGRYSLSLIKSLCVRNPNIDFILYCTNLGKKGNLDLLAAEIKTWGLENCDVLLLDIFQDRKFISIREAQRNLKKKIFEMDPSHILIVSNFEHPMDALLLEGKFFKNSAIIIHDLIPLHYKSELLPSRSLVENYQTRLQTSMLSPIIFTNSLFTLKDYVDKTGRTKNIVNIGGAGFFENRETELLQWGDRRGILCIGADTPHKNIKNLICAYAILPEHIRHTHPLYLVGIKNQSLYREVLQKHQSAMSGIHFFEFLSDADLAQLYSSVVFVAVPSFIEGLSMPIFESWSCGTPAVVSKNTVMDEIVGDSESTFDPMSPVDMGVTFAKFLDVEAIWRNSHLLLMNRRQQYSWNKVASKMDFWLES